MRTPRMLLFSGLMLSACSDQPAAPVGDGSLTVATVTTGLDFDSDGYHLTVDGTVRASASATGTMTITRLDPGGHIVGLSGVAANCMVQVPKSQVVSIIEGKIDSLEFAVVCTATSGVMKVVLAASGSQAPDAYEVRLDGGAVYPIRSGEPVYLSPVSQGGHSVSLLLPDDCSVQRNPRSVTVTVGGLSRDTADAAFLVACGATTTTALRVTAPTTGPVPPDDDYFDGSFRVLLLGPDPWDFPAELGRLEPNGTLLAPVLPGHYQLQLQVPGSCYVTVANPTSVFTIGLGSTLDFEIPVDCSPPSWD
jgi:hypothetical protein